MIADTVNAATESGSPVAGLDRAQVEHRLQPDAGVGEGGKRSEGQQEPADQDADERPVANQGQIEHSVTRPATAREPTTLEPADHVLLDLLARDGRTSYVILARAAGMNEGQVVRHVEAMQSNGVLYFDIDLAGVALGYPTSAYLWLTVTPAHLESVGSALAQHDEVPFAAAISGPANLVASVTCRSLDHFYGYVTTKIAAIQGVQSLEISPVLRRIKQAGALMAGDRLANPEPSRRRGRAT